MPLCDSLSFSFRSLYGGSNARSQRNRSLLEAANTNISLVQFFGDVSNTFSSNSRSLMLYAYTNISG